MGVYIENTVMYRNMVRPETDWQCLLRQNVEIRMLAYTLTHLPSCKFNNAFRCIHLDGV